MSGVEVFHVIRVGSIGDSCDETVGVELYYGNEEECKQYIYSNNLKDGYSVQFRIMPTAEWAERRGLTLIHFCYYCGNGRPCDCGIENA